MVTIFIPSAHASSDDDEPDPKSGGPSALEQPAITGPLQPNPHPAAFTTKPLGTINVSGVVTGYGLLQDTPSSEDRSGRIDFSNLQIVLQKEDGPIQFYVQAGIYSIPELGMPNSGSVRITSQMFGFVPVVYGKIKLSEEFSIQSGKLPSLIGGERTFTFQNMNIEQGLLFNQSNNINKGVQITYNSDSTTVSGSINDGFYSDHLTWLTGSLIYKIDEADRVNFSAGANLDRTAHESIATPLLQNNSSIYNLSYTHKSGPWILSPYFQATHVPHDPKLGIAESASTWGGALRGSYAFTSDLALACRIEYIAQSGQRGMGTTNLLYGPGSRAVSATVTPTYQIDRYFVRGEYSYVRAFHTTPSLVFGHSGMKSHQSRFAVESGILF
ncbi:outer membrane beta-barrel protein [Methylobacterium oxalidis]|uniref:outer membrane beta-barrel protein n=1 Tax=Methylobacterium oxalidis TaxID=944322 RepID=UPI0033155A1A